MDTPSKTRLDQVKIANGRKSHVDYMEMYEIFAWNDNKMDWVSTNMRYSCKLTALERAMQIYPEVETKVEVVYDHPVFRFN